jgi:Ribbon-helix-helix protein, copG family
MSLTRTNIYLDEKQLERLRAKGERDKLPVSQIVRRARDAYLAWDDPASCPTPSPWGSPEGTALSSPA